jgi:hypothetical protein
LRKIARFSLGPKAATPPERQDASLRRFDTALGKIEAALIHIINLAVIIRPIASFGST